MSETKTGIELIAEERREQLVKHGRTVESDVRNNNECQLVDAASVLCQNNPEEFQDMFVSSNEEFPPIGWEFGPWAKLLRKPYKERLVIAGALIAAEIDRITKIENDSTGKTLEDASN